MEETTGQPINMEEANTTEKGGGEEEPPKEVRRRKKRLIHQITAQMDFYFSSANITKDRFMASLLEDGPYINLEIFFKFNRIRSLTNDINLLRKAVSKSSLLELSEDGLSVKRKTNIEKKDNEMECTIYVENIPSHVDHDWVRQVFAQYGTIDYISLPRYRRSGRPKGFAFVEFKTPEMASSALEGFGSLECRISATIDPSQLQSIKSYEGVMSEEPSNTDVEGALYNYDCSVKQRIMKNMKCGDMNFEMSVEVEDERKGKLGNDGVERKESKRRGFGDELEEKESDLEDSFQTAKKQKVDVVDSQMRREVGDVMEKKVREMRDKMEEESDLDIIHSAREQKVLVLDNIKKRKMGNDVEEDSDHDDNIQSQKVDVADRKKKRELEDKESDLGCGKSGKKQKVDVGNPDQVTSIESVEKKPIMEVPAVSGKKNKKKKRKRSKKGKEDEVESIYLKVMSKQDWKKLRNQYLNTQREIMRSLKGQLRERYSIQSIDYSDHSNPNLIQIPKASYRDDEPSKSIEDAVPKNESSKPHFIPNAVIKISFEEPPQDPKKLRETIREGGSGGVAYVDVSATERDVFVRFLSEDAASAYKKAGYWSRMEILSGIEEEEYWKRIVDCWSQQRGRKNKQNKKGSQIYPNQVRGREKLLQKAFRESQNTKPNAYIIFED